jgi:NADPH2:quinone reductase
LRSSERKTFAKVRKLDRSGRLKVVLLRSPGGPEVLEVCEAPVPVLRENEVLIKADAFGVGHPDALIRKGIYMWMPPLPANPGNDLAGRIAGLGPGVSGVGLGQKVLLSARDLARRGGCYAEYIAVPADAVHNLPEHVDPEQAVALSNYQVAYALLHEAAGPRKPRSVLIVGAAGGVGSALVQLAKVAGMTVIGSVSGPEKAAFARVMGVDHIVNYRERPVPAAALELTGGRGVDLILDHVGGPAFTDHLAALANWGTLVSYNAFTGLPDKDLLAEMRAHVGKSPAVRCFSFHSYDHDREGRRRLMGAVIELLGQGAVSPAIGARFSLSEVRQAHALIDAGTALGKIVMRP